MRILIACSMLLAGHAMAAEIYKCKGAQGEVVFTNTQCPDAATTEHYATYAPVDDANTHFDPNSDQATAATPRAARSAEKSQRDIQADLAAIANEDPRSTLGSAARNARMDLEFGTGPRSERQAAYDQKMAILRAAATGSAPPATIRVADSGTAEAAEPPQPPPQQAPSITSCSAKVNGHITCVDTNGAASHGRINAAGNATVGGERLHRDAAGNLKTTNGVCVRDMYGKCQ